MTNPIIEAMARAMCALHENPDTVVGFQPVPTPTGEPTNVIETHRRWQYYMPDARAALAAALKEAGLKSVIDISSDVQNGVAATILLEIKMTKFIRDLKDAAEGEE